MELPRVNAAIGRAAAALEIGATNNSIFPERVEANAIHVPSGEKLQGFELAGADKKRYWADAVIDGATVVLSSPKVPAPVSARYAWGNFDITWANLFNADGLPALTFRTDGR